MIGSNTLNTELNRGHDSFMRQLADMWIWVRNLEDESKTKEGTYDERTNSGQGKTLEN